jgi:hypothetical protein
MTIEYQRMLMPADANGTAGHRQLVARQATLDG